MTTIKPVKKTIGELLNSQHRVFYTVPPYQREYQWKKDNWNALFNDLDENDSGYFIGSIISINREVDHHKLSEIELVDGQQRLTTISLLLIAIYNNLESRSDSSIQTKLNQPLSELRKLLVVEGQQNTGLIVLQKQNNNKSDYEWLLHSAALSSIKPSKPTNFGNRRIAIACKHFESLIKEKSLEETLKLLDKVKNAFVIDIIAEKVADAYLLFESLNNRGMKLTAVDLIKNKLLAKLDKSYKLDQNEIAYYYDQWTNLIELLGEKINVQERFLAQYYNAFRKDMPPRDNSTKSIAIRSNLIIKYEQLIEYDPKRFLTDVVRCGEVYSQILIPENCMFNYLQKPLQALRRIEGAPSYVLVLYLLIKYSNHELEENHLSKVINLLVSFFVRRNLTDVPPTRELIELFVRVVDELDGKTSNEVTDCVKSILQQKSVTDGEFKKKLKGPIYNDKKAVTSFILRSLEENNKTKEKYDIWEKEKKKRSKRLIWTIEHILPQGKSIEPRWVDEIAGGDSVKAKEIHSKYVHCIGNLTITGVNSELGTKSFLEKKKLFNKSLYLNQSLENETSWGKEQIKRRTDKLVDEVMNIFNFE